MQDKKENKNSTLEDEADFSDSTKDNQEEQKDNTLQEKESSENTDEKVEGCLLAKKEKGKISRNEVCPATGKKFKQCCGALV